MGCRDSDYSDDNYWGKYEGTIDKLNKVTNLLCSLLRKVEEESPSLISEPELIEWWGKHKIADKHRRQEEALQAMQEENLRLEKLDKDRIKSEALAKLTDDEKKALGVSIFWRYE
jgi:hypothetical protein